MNGRYEITHTFYGIFSFSLYSAPGRPLLESGEYSTMPLCRKGIASVRLNCDAPLEDHCEKADGVATDETAGKIKCPKFVLSRRDDGMYRLALFAKNGKCIAESPAIATADAAYDSLDKIRRVAREARVIL